MKKWSLAIMAIFYISAGANHFRNPGTYYTIIPPYFSNPQLLNTVSGIAEILLGILLVIPSTRKFAAYAIIAMLIAFIPAHIYMIEAGFCIKTFCLPVWALWARLLILQPLLIFWAWHNRK
ncbi:MAG TPA: DoxX family membrane protein [Ferruginibacter sp.]|nr:DoxX family membrane protein [Ferruginibacter sp.]